MEVEQDEPPLVCGRCEEKIVELDGGDHIDYAGPIAAMFLLTWYVAFGGRRRIGIWRCVNEWRRRLQQWMRAQLGGDFGHVAGKPLQDPQRR